jgi:RimJ/RimL family protein N-acetyltransferase
MPGPELYYLLRYMRDVSLIEFEEHRESGPAVLVMHLKQTRIGKMWTRRGCGAAQAEVRFRARTHDPCARTVCSPRARTTKGHPRCVRVGEMPQAGSIRLLPMTPAFLEALLADRREEAERELDIVLFADYPSDGERRFLAMRLRQMYEDVRFQVWGEHAFVLGEQMVGHGGYDGPPGSNAARAPDAVELGYAIFAPYRGRGYGTVAARTLMDMAEKRANVRHFVLAVSPTNAPSLAIAHKLGFRKTGERIDDTRGLEHVFELHRDAEESPRAAPRFSSDIA